MIQRQFTNRVGRVDRGVKQAGFYVLWNASMPSVLVELGFVTNPTEAAFLQTEDGSAEDNRVSAGRGVGAPPIIDYDRNRIPAARDEHRTFVKRFCRDLRRAGYIAFSQPIGLHGTAHACGTMRAGTNPRNSAVDSCGRVHGFEGLRVADGSILPRSSRVNPALTIYAWGLHVANEIAKSRGSRVSVSQSAAFERAAVEMTVQ